MKTNEYSIKLHRFSNEQDPEKPVWAPDDLNRTKQLCQLIGTTDTLFSTTQLISIGAKFEYGHQASVPVTEWNNPYQCANCEFMDDYDNLPQAQDIVQRMEPGDTYTDVQCPECGCLCFPAEDADEEPVNPNAKLTIGLFRRLTNSLPDDAVITYHGHDKGCCLLAHHANNVWLYPKGETPTHVVINPGRNYDHRKPGEPVPAPDELTIADYEEVLADHRRLARELDVILHGEEGAAKQASLCDIVAKVATDMRLKKHLCPATPVFSEGEMIELLEFARLALQDADFFDRMGEECDLSDDYLVKLRDKLQAVMDSDVPIFNRQSIVPGMRVRWNDPDNGECSREGVVSKCTTPIEDDIIVLHMEDGWCCECLRKEIEILPPQEPKVLLGDIDPARVGSLGDRVGATMGSSYLPVFLNDLHDARAHGLNKEDIMRAWSSACDDVLAGDHYPETTRGNQVVPAIPM